MRSERRKEDALSKDALIKAARDYVDILDALYFDIKELRHVPVSLEFNIRLTGALNNTCRSLVRTGYLEHWSPSIYTPANSSNLVKDVMSGIDQNMYPLYIARKVMRNLLSEVTKDPHKIIDGFARENSEGIFVLKSSSLEELAVWLTDPSERIRAAAQDWLEILQKEGEKETLRVTEGFRELD